MCPHKKFYYADKNYKETFVFRNTLYCLFYWEWLYKIQHATKTPVSVFLQYDCKQFVSSVALANIHASARVW